jgi:ankyrin repeat protein
MASRGSQWDVVEALICEDVDVNVRGPLGCTALFWATLSGRLDVVSMLLDLNAVDANVKNNAGSTALDIARNCQMVDIAKCLEKHACSC